MSDLWQRLKRLDAFPKIRDDEFYQRTLSGGVITISSAIIMLFLFFSELGEQQSAPTPCLSRPR